MGVEGIYNRVIILECDGKKEERNSKSRVEGGIYRQQPTHRPAGRSVCGVAMHGSPSKFVCRPRVGVKQWPDREGGSGFAPATRAGTLGSAIVGRWMLMVWSVYGGPARLVAAAEEHWTGRPVCGLLGCLPKRKRRSMMFRKFGINGFAKAIHCYVKRYVS